MTKQDLLKMTFNEQLEDIPGVLGIDTERMDEIVDRVMGVYTRSQLDDKQSSKTQAWREAIDVLKPQNAAEYFVIGRAFGIIEGRSGALQSLTDHISEQMDNRPKSPLRPPTNKPSN